MKCIKCGLQSYDPEDFTYFPKEPENPMCHECTLGYAYRNG